MLGRLLDTQLSPKLIELREIHSRCPRCKNVFISDAELLERPMEAQGIMPWCHKCNCTFSSFQMRDGKLLTRKAMEDSLCELAPRGPPESRIVSPLPSPVAPAG